MSQSGAHQPSGKRRSRRTQAGVNLAPVSRGVRRGGVSQIDKQRHGLGGDPEQRREQKKFWSERAFAASAACLSRRPAPTTAAFVRDALLLPRRRCCSAGDAGHGGPGDAGGQLSVSRGCRSGPRRRNRAGRLAFSTCLFGRWSTEAVAARLAARGCLAGSWLRARASRRRWTRGWRWQDAVDAGGWVPRAPLVGGKTSSGRGRRPAQRANGQTRPGDTSRSMRCTPRPTAGCLARPCRCPRQCRASASAGAGAAATLGGCAPVRLRRAGD